MTGRGVNEQSARLDPAVGPVLIIGAGPAGLAAAAELRHHGVPSRILDRADAVASSWRARYDALRLNTCRWNSVLRVGDRYAPGTPFFPLREHAVAYLENFAAKHEADVQFGVQVNRIESDPEGWCVFTSAGPMTARQVIVATGHQHTPWLPDWPGKDEYAGRIVHSWNYRNPKEFQGLDVLVVGAGCSGLDIARDLAQGGAAHVQIAAGTQPNLLRKKSLGLPTDLLAAVLHRVPVRVADSVGRFVQRSSIGDLRQWGLSRPEEGIFTRQHRDGDPPVIVGDDVFDAIRNRQFEIVAGVSSVGADGVRLADGTRLQPDAIVAATGYTSGLETVVGHLGVLDEHGNPLNYRQPAIQPGLHFLGYAPCMGVIGRDAKRVVRHVLAELNSSKFTAPA
jgi:cation diffusion facilitator CzcD-associated flavoprotein CzcO